MAQEKRKPKFHVTYEYSDGREGAKDFDSLDEWHRWAFSEGDHLIDYTLHVVNSEKT